MCSILSFIGRSAWKRNRIIRSRREKNILKKKNIFRYGELNPGLAGLMLCLRAADASHYTITDYVMFSQLINMIAIVNGTSTQP
jgi:hypothetical protein